MDKYLKNYIDNQIIREYGIKFKNQYHLQVEDIDDQERENLLSVMYQYDDTLKEMILDHMQDLINSRLNIVSSEDNYDSGLKPIHDSETGEINWIPRRVA